NTAARTFEGTGIGLSLVKELVNLHQGDIRVFSKEGKGTRFVVSIPTGKDHLDASDVFENEDLSYTSGLSDLYVSEARTLMANELLPELANNEDRPMKVSGRERRSS